MTTKGNNNSVKLLFEVKDFEPSSWTWHFLDKEDKQVGEGFNLIPLQDYIRVTGEVSTELRKLFIDLLGANEITIYFSAPESMEKIVQGYLQTEEYVLKSFREIQLPDAWDFSHQEEKKQPFRKVKIFAK